MKPVAYYNEIDSYAAQWLRNLISAGHIAPGDVDERSIEDVKPDDLRNYTQCHFFAGIGVWSYALRNAGWPDDKPVWTGSCPCQPFSAAGKGSGFDDERHLWPHFHWLISECRPQHVFGEQVASGNANAWFDLVQADLETMEYAFGLVPFPSAGVGAPHIRDRAYWVANTNSECWNGGGNRGQTGWDEYPVGSNAGRMAISNGFGRERWERPSQRGEYYRKVAGWFQGQHGAECGGEVSTDRMADAIGERSPLGVPESEQREERQSGEPNNCGGEFHRGKDAPTELSTMPTNGFWRDADWLLCRDEKWRPVRPGSFPLVDGATSRVGRLRAYGNAINAEAATIFITAYMSTMRK